MLHSKTWLFCSLSIAVAFCFSTLLFQTAGASAASPESSAEGDRQPLSSTPEALSSPWDKIQGMLENGETPAPGGSDSTTGQPAVVVPDGSTYVEVSDAVSLLSAIQSDRVIRLLPGDYNLSGDAVNARIKDGAFSSSGGVTYVEDYEDAITKGLRIEGVENLTLYSQDGVELYTQRLDDTVLSFRGCKNVTVNGLVLGHKPEASHDVCVAGVVSIENCSEVLLEGCELYGCGTVGTFLSESSGISVKDSLIRNCVYNAAMILHCEDVTFDNVEIRNVSNDYLSGDLVLIEDKCEKVAFDRCNIHDNGYRGNKDASLRTAIFCNCTSDPDQLTVTDCTFEDNNYDATYFNS
jgi:hypothetical protein